MDSAEPFPWEQTHQPIPMVAQRGRRISSDNLNSDGWRAHYPRLSAPIAVWQRKLLEQQFQRQHVAIIANQLGWLGSRCSVSTGPSVIKDLQTLPIILQFILESAVVQFLLFYEEVKLFILSLLGAVKWDLGPNLPLIFLRWLGNCFFAPFEVSCQIHATHFCHWFALTFDQNILSEHSSFSGVKSSSVKQSFFFHLPSFKGFFYWQIQIGRCLLFMSKN